MNTLIQKKKSTEELRHEIKSATDIEDYLIQNKEELQLPHLSDALHLMLSQKEISRADVVRGSLLDRSYVYQIFSGQRTPSRDKLIAIAFGMHLSDTQTQTLLKLSHNQELYARAERDALILFALQREMSIMETNDLLFTHGFTVLGTTQE